MSVSMKLAEEEEAEGAEEEEEEEGDRGRRFLASVDFCQYGGDMFVRLHCCSTLLLIGCCGATIRTRWTLLLPGLIAMMHSRRDCACCDTYICTPVRYVRLYRLYVLVATMEWFCTGTSAELGRTAVAAAAR